MTPSDKGSKAMSFLPHRNEVASTVREEVTVDNPMLPIVKSPYGLMDELRERIEMLEKVVGIIPDDTRYGVPINVYEAQ